MSERLGGCMCAPIGSARGMGEGMWIVMGGGPPEVGGWGGREEGGEVGCTAGGIERGKGDGVNG